MSKTSNDEKTMRSVFVGNIPYEATEEQLKEIFQQVGPVSSFRIVYDRETGKPKGYGFCEYQDLETAQSAMRNLNDFDFHGRNLRVGHAAGEQSNAEKVQAQAAPAGPPEEETYGARTDSDKAPEAISKAVASLPPEQMFELMKQMKLCIQNNPNEARNMLLQNPQLAYALLQAQIVMKIVDPQVALAMLHRQSEEIPPLVPSSNPAPAAAPVEPKPPILPSPVQQPPPGRSPMDTDMDMRSGPIPGLTSNAPPMVAPSPAANSLPGQGPPRGGLLGDRPGDTGFDNRMPPGRPNDRDPYMDRRGPEPDRYDGPPQDRYGGPPPPRGGPGRDMSPHGGPPPQRGYDDRRGGPGGPPYGGPPRDDRYGGPPHGGPAGPGAPGGMMGGRGGDPRGNDPRAGDSRGGGGVDPRGSSGGGGAGGDPRDPRNQRMPPTSMAGPRPGGPPGGSRAPPMGVPRPAAPPPAAGAPTGAQDQEKAALIMQVLQLTDEQIAMLPQEQRASILILKDQIARSTGKT